MEYVVYILYSPSAEKIYIGCTSDLINRFRSHNSLSKKGFTTRYRPWMVAHVEFFEVKSEAFKREKQLKAGTGRRWIHTQFLPSLII